ncbi:chemotaxis protein CheW [Butyrivibrio sp. YAB3001]|uniref:chemotaxis protein CheW n=1 Tax=Butyrivibrio sp. YAB3001 TaxID=1520812 RepID=UPI0008F66070|nr:chemotaxis protein CheW [Butyrivibrio sp. YAB3001]SFD06546.1 purine-binding chemotaxis protein CheW [Butyrivibrio sp. YAB3001]
MDKFEIATTDMNSDSSKAVTNKKRDTKYVIFDVNNGKYGIDVNHVNTVINMPTITKIPKTPAHYKGIISLRGEVIPIISLRKKISLEEDVVTADSRVIITEMDDDRKVGLIVDSVKEVVAIPDDDIMEPSQFLKGQRTLIYGVAKKGDNIISFFDVELLA